VSEPLNLRIDASTRYCAVFGFPIRHSASPAMQNAGIEAIGLPWRYLAFEVRPSQLKEALAGAKAMRFLGVNLTVPHKLLALELVDELDASARTWGAVNTVRLEARGTDGQWKPLREFVETPEQVRMQGFNTDADALSRAIREDLGMNPSGATVLVLGAGGAGRTAALKLASEGPAALHLVNRTREKAASVANEIASRYPKVKVTLDFPAGNCDLVINATSLGLKPADPLPVQDSQFDLRRTGCVYDMIYRPAETPFLQKAKSRGCRVANGLGMLLYQGAAALELWSGQSAPIEIMREALRKHVYG